MVEHQTSGTFVLVVGRVMRYLICCTGTADLYLAVLKANFNLFLGHPPPGGPGGPPGATGDEAGDKKKVKAEAAAKVAASNKAGESKTASKSGPVAAKGDDEADDIEAAGAEAEEGEEEQKVVEKEEEEEDEEDRATYSTAAGSPLPPIFLVSLPRGRKQLCPNIRGVRFYPSTSVGTARCLQIRFPIAACQPVASVVSQPLDTGPRPLLAVAHSRR